MAEYKGNIPLKMDVRAKQEDLYGPEFTKEKHGTVRGACHAARGVFTLAADNLQDFADARKTL